MYYVYLQSRTAETEMYQGKISQMEHEFKMMHEQLTSDIKLLRRYSDLLRLLQKFINLI